MPPVQESALPPEEREDYFSLTFRTLKAPIRKFTLHTSSVRTVAQVKRHLARISNIPVASMRLVLGGKGLVDSKLIGDYPISKDSVIQIIAKPAGAADAQSAQETEKLNAMETAVSENNPLSSVLDKERSQQVSDAPAVISAAAHSSAHADTHEHDYTSDASSEADPNAVSSATRDQLKQKNSAFRSGLRDLVNGQFGATQAAAVNSLLDSYLSTL
ncbi:hypothetical protein GGI12_001842 [Dipsacomyces acuminosporus]|nr:hypothetical protein GGI12_001842 [Dipsacomyces acuminosporus]